LRLVTAVLQVLTDDDRRGAQVFGYELGGRLIDSGYDVRTVALTHGSTGGLDIEVLGPARRSGVTLRRLRVAMAGSDVTIAHGSTTLFACGVAGLGPARPFVYRQISDPEFWAPTRAKRHRTRMLYRLPAHVVALSDSTAHTLQRLYSVDSRRLTVIPNAVDERRCRLASDAERTAARAELAVPDRPALVVAYVGALVPEKGVDDLLHAMPPRACVLVAGDGPDRDLLAASAHRLGVDCRFLGRMTDPRVAYAAADVLVLPSRGGDTQPAALLEAALVGTPLVATDVGAVSDIVINGVTGVLIEPGDIDALSGALRRLSVDSTARTVLAAQASAHVRERFSLDSVASGWSAVLERVWAGR
jgi:glycosyltransferase involved in cell wall biosynthesis